MNPLSTGANSTPSVMFPTSPICWVALTDTQTAKAIASLEDWVTVIVYRYGLDHRTVPPCWQHHGALVEELSALFVGWVAAHAAGARPQAPLQWHAEFAAARLRLGEWASRTGCRPGEHRDDRA